MPRGRAVHAYHSQTQWTDTSPLTPIAEPVSGIGTQSAVVQ